MSSDKNQQNNKPITDDAIFKVAKEVAIKFIEVGRLSPDGFPEGFDSIYKSIRNTVQDHQQGDD